MSMPSATTCRTGVVLLYLVMLATAGRPVGWALASGVGLLAIWAAPLISAHAKGAVIRRMTAPSAAAVEPVTPG